MYNVTIVLSDDRTAICDVSIIGKNNENIATTLEIILTPTMANKDIYLEFKKANNETISTTILDKIVDESGNWKVSYEIPNSLLDIEGNLYLEVVVRGENNLVWKSFTKKFVVKNSINARYVLY